MPFTHKLSISDELVMKYSLGFHPDPGKTEVVGFPSSKTSAEIRFIGDNVLHNKRYKVLGSQHCFMFGNLLENRNRPIFVVEGAIDALSVEEVGGLAVGLCGTMVLPLASMLRDEFAHTDYPLLLALDNDSAGKEATQKLSQYFDSFGLPYKVVDIFGEYNDPNDALLADRDAFAKRVR